MGGLYSTGRFDAGYGNAISFNGTNAQVTIPNSNGEQAKTLVIVPAFKFKLVSYTLSSASPFRLFREDVAVRVKPWGDPGPYQIVRPFGGGTEAKAEV